MEKLELNLELINKLMDKLNETNLGSLELSFGDVKISIKAKGAGVPINNQAMAAVPTAAVQNQTAQTSAVQPQPELQAKPQESGNIVTSPIVGTFYAAASPEKPSFVKVGQKVKKGDILYIVESMKLMNEIASEFDGTVTKILVENGSPVEFGQEIMVIE